MFKVVIYFNTFCLEFIVIIYIKISTPALMEAELCISFFYIKTINFLSTSIEAYISFKVLKEYAYVLCIQ